MEFLSLITSNIEFKISIYAFNADFLRVKNSLEQVLLQSEEELLARRSSDLVSEGVAPKPKKIIGKMKVQGIFMFSYFSFLCISSYLQEVCMLRPLSPL